MEDHSCTSRSFEEVDTTLLISATGTVGAPDSKEDNVYSQSAEVLCEDNLTTAVSECSHSNTFVIRPSTTFANDSDSRFLEIRYPDLFPFGRGGFGEPRKIPISRKTLLRYMLNLSTRQFQQADFLLPVYDVVTRQ